MTPPPASSFALRVSCGPTKTQLAPLMPNTSTATPLLPAPKGVRDVQLKVFIEQYRGPSGCSAQESHPYFSHPSRKGELYALRIDFTPDEPIAGDDLVLGNDFDRPIRDKLPFWFGGAWKALKWVDPGIEGDVYADQPGIFGRVLGSVNVLEASDVSPSTSTSTNTNTNTNTVPRSLSPPRAKGHSPSSSVSSSSSSGGREDVDASEAAGDVIFEALAGGPEVAELEAAGEHVPTDPAARRKFFLDEERRRRFTFLPGRRYRLDFGNGFIDFNEFGLKLPGFKVNVLKYWDGQPLRYVLKNRRTEEVYAVVAFELVDGTADGKAK